MKMKNDLAFLIDFNLYLFEHQSDVNKNIPLRFLQYVDKVRMYAKKMPIEDAVDNFIEHHRCGADCPQR